MERRKETHRSYTASFKLNIVKVAAEKGKSFASKLFNVDRKQVCEWIKKSRNKLTMEQVFLCFKLWINELDYATGLLKDISVS